MSITLVPTDMPEELSQEEIYAKELEAWRAGKEIYIGSLEKEVAFLEEAMTDKQKEIDFLKQQIQFAKDRYAKDIEGIGK